MELSKLDRIKGNKKKGKRLGLGYGSGKGGHTSGSGSKGQKARSKVSIGFEGGQTPLYKQLPTLGGFRNPTTKQIVGLSLSVLNKFKDGDEVTPQSLVDAKIVIRVPRHGLKILNTGKIEKKISLKGFMFSASARKTLEKAGCKIIDA
jgi:large subunit ribosomal protein L15